MTTRTVTVPLKGFGCAPTEARVQVATLTPRQRLARAGMAVGAGVVAALIALPIPLVHLLFVPGALLAGLVVGALRLRQREIFQSAEAACPFCGAVQRLGLAGKVFRLPRVVYCSTCLRQLELTDGAA